MSNKKHTFHKENCDSTVRAVVEDKFGSKVTLLGQHAFEWSIIIEKEGKIIITSFSNRVQATKEFNNIKKCNK